MRKTGLHGTPAAMLAGLLVTVTCLAADLDLGPLLRIEDSHEGHRVTALGPLLEWAATPDGKRAAAVRPLWSRVDDPADDRLDRDVLWPLGALRLRENRCLTYFGSALLIDADITDPNSPERRYLLPFRFAGRSESGDTYRAWFPIGGTVRDVIGLDRIDFVLFPLALNTAKNEVRGYHRLFPVFAHVTGPDLEKRRVFPLWGVSRTEDWVNRFAFWPFLHLGYSPDPERPGSGLFILPLYGRLDYGTPGQPGYQRRRTILWPFFSYALDAGGERLSLPWPFYRRATTRKPDGRESMHLWPLWGRTSGPGGDSTYWLWPFCRDFNREAGARRTHRSYRLPFYWSFQYREGERLVLDYRRWWPLLSVERGDEGSRWRCLALWPQRQAAPIERNWAPFWTVAHGWRRPESSGNELLWGLWHYRQDETGTRGGLFPLLAWHSDHQNQRQRVQLLTGLIGWERTPERTRLQLLWLLHF